MLYSIAPPPVRSRSGCQSRTTRNCRPCGGISSLTSVCCLGSTSMVSVYHLSQLKRIPAGLRQEAGYTLDGPSQDTYSTDNSAGQTLKNVILSKSNMHLFEIWQRKLEYPEKIHTQEEYANPTPCPNPEPRTV